MTWLIWFYVGAGIGYLVFFGYIVWVVARAVIKARKARKARYERDYTMCVWECSVCLADRERVK